MYASEPPQNGLSLIGVLLLVQTFKTISDLVGNYFGEFGKVFDVLHHVIQALYNCLVIVKERCHFHVQVVWH